MDINKEVSKLNKRLRRMGKSDYQSQAFSSLQNVLKHSIFGKQDKTNDGLMTFKNITNMNIKDFNFSDRKKTQILKDTLATSSKKSFKNEQAKEEYLLNLYLKRQKKDFIKHLQWYENKPTLSQEKKRQKNQLEAFNKKMYDDDIEHKQDLNATQYKRMWKLYNRIIETNFAPSNDIIDELRIDIRKTGKQYMRNDDILEKYSFSFESNTSEERKLHLEELEGNKLKGF